MFPAGPGALLVRVEAVLVPAAAAVPEARAALRGGVVVPLEHKLGARAFLFGKLADVGGRGGGCGEEHGTRGDRLGFVDPQLALIGRKGGDRGWKRYVDEREEMIWCRFPPTLFTLHTLNTHYPPK